FVSSIVQDMMENSVPRGMGLSGPPPGMVGASSVTQGSLVESSAESGSSETSLRGGRKVRVEGEVGQASIGQARDVAAKGDRNENCRLDLERIDRAIPCHSLGSAETDGDGCGDRADGGDRLADEIPAADRVD